MGADAQSVVFSSLQFAAAMQPIALLGQDQFPDLLIRNQKRLVVLFVDDAVLVSHVLIIQFEVRILPASNLERGLRYDRVLSRQAIIQGKVLVEKVHLLYVPPLWVPSRRYSGHGPGTRTM